MRHQVEKSPLTVGNFDAVRRALSDVAHGPVVAAAEALSFWGGVDPATSRVIDVHHPLHGVSLAGSILMMPTSRGSCSGSGVLLDMALNGRAPAALVFSDAEDVLDSRRVGGGGNVRQAAPGLAGGPDCVRRSCAGEVPRDQRKLCRRRGCDDPHRATRRWLVGRRDPEPRRAASRTIPISPLRRL